MISVILCGGVGSRLWPISRELFPKPFLRLADGQSFMQKTFLRGAHAPGVKSMLTVTNRDLFFKVREEFKDAGISLETAYILEPFGRNTAPAIAVAALYVEKYFGPEAPILILPSDHLINDKDGFYEAVTRAAELAVRGRLVTFGIKPVRPDTGFGYIEADGENVIRFVEKPSLDKAREYVADGNYLWNSGMFCFQAGIILAEMKRHAPEVFDAVKTCVETSSVKTSDAGSACFELDKGSFAETPSISVDFAVMEKSDRVSVVRCDVGWNDVGSWSELCSLDAEDESGNHVSMPENTVLRDTTNCNIKNRDRMVATIGIDNLLIVDTPDALLVADNSRMQDVKDIYNHLKAKGHESYKQHRTIYTPWGSYTMLEYGPRFKIKRLILKPDSSISLQLHHHRNEHWIVVSGMATVTCDDAVSFINTNESVYLKAGTKHRVANSGKIELVIIEVQTGDYLGEDDILRFDDKYGRPTS